MTHSLFWFIPILSFALGMLIGRAWKRLVPGMTQKTAVTGTRSIATDAQARWLAMYAMANGNRDRAQFILEQDIETTGSIQPDDWIMLLDIHHSSGNRDRFDTLASRFAEQFHATAPEFTQWKQLQPDSSGLNRRHEKLLALLQSLPDREQQKKFMVSLALESTKPGRPAFTLGEAEELLKLRARFNPKPAPSLNLTGSIAMPTGAWNHNAQPVSSRAVTGTPSLLGTGNIVPPQSALGRTGSQNIQNVAPPSMTQNEPCALERQFKRIADKIAESWPSVECSHYIDSLLVDNRGGRQGFPPEVVSELFLLHALLEDHNPSRRDLWDQAPLR